MNKEIAASPPRRLSGTEALFESGLDDMDIISNKFAYNYSQRRGPQVVNMAVVFVIALLGMAVRMYRLDQPPNVVFDEVHFGGYASKYITSDYFVDVHPPLGKLLITATGVLSGYNGSFSFKSIGLSYTNHSVPYVAMRALPAFLGALTGPMAYATLRNFGFSEAASVLTGSLVIFENAFVSQFRLIMLDAFLVFFVSLTVLLWSEFQRTQSRPFSLLWWRTLAFTGIALGLTISVKWVGLFTVLLIGFFTVRELWVIVIDGTIPLAVFGKHLGARVLCLILLPAAIYMSVFKVHLNALTNKGNGAVFMSPEFQSTLNGAEVTSTWSDVGFGSKIILRHEATSGGYLHSHRHDYPDGSKQQQITCYGFRDGNSWFKIKHPLVTKRDQTFEEQPIRGFVPITHMTIVRLEHVATDKRLHSHSVRLGWNDDKELNEVSGYGHANFLGDTNDHWVVEILGNARDDTSPVKAISTRVRFRHANTGCYLYSRESKLPEWGFGQQEVACSDKALKSLTVWRIEATEHPEMPKTAVQVNYNKPGFYSKFFELHKVMWHINSGFKGSHPYDSKPTSWPLLKRGIFFWSGPSGNIYLMGNPLIWWSALAGTLVYIAFECLFAIATKRNLQVFQLALLKESGNACWFFLCGWALHYLPFFLMKRQLFIHHYLPALYFSILLLGSLIDVATIKLKRIGQSAVSLAFGLAAVIVFWVYSPLAYGTEMSHGFCLRLKLVSSWDFDCSRYLTK